MMELYDTTPHVFLDNENFVRITNQAEEQKPSERSWKQTFRVRE